MEYDEMLEKVLKEKKGGKGERFMPPEPDVGQVGQKTVINAEELAKYINRPVVHIAKYLMHELTAPGQVDESGKITIGGRFSRRIVLEKINNYIKEYVICKQDGSPDTQMLKIDNNTVIKCLACGAEYPVGRIK